MAASYVSNITINAGSDFTQTFNFETVGNTPLNLSGYTAYSVMKKSPASSKTSASFNIIFENRAFGKISIALGSSITSTLKPGRYSYDVLLIGPSPEFKKTRVVEGSAIVSAGITTA